MSSFCVLPDFAEELTKKMVTAGETPPTIGLISTAIGGSMIEEWLPNVTSAQCTGSSVAAHDETLWTQNVIPFLPMTLKGWLWYQCVCIRLYLDSHRAAALSVATACVASVPPSSEP
jgi:hypothetical protein